MSPLINMGLLSRWQLLLLDWLIGALPVVLAQTCTPPWGEVYGHAYLVANDSSMDELANSCTTINGSIVITNSFTGPFYLPNIQKITDLIQGEVGFTATASPTSIDMPDLESVDGNIWFTMPTLANVSMPKLKASTEIQIAFVQQMHMPLLESLGSALITGTFSSLQLDSLRNVEYELSICNMNGCSQDEYPTDSMDVSLSSLQSAGALYANGSVASLAVPNLTTINNPDGIAGLTVISHAGQPVNLSFPLLNSISNTLTLNGNISSISMPSLFNLSAECYIDASTPLNISLPLQKALNIELSGSIQSVQLPSLISVNALYVNSNLPLDCDSLVETLEQQTNNTSTTSYVNQIIQCTSSAKKSHSGGGGLKTGVKAAIGAVVSVVGAAILIGAEFFCIKRRRNERSKTVASNLELDDSMPPAYQHAQAEHEPAPEYSPRES